MSPLPSMPIGDPVETTGITTTGSAFLIPTGSNGEIVVQIKVSCTAKCYIAFGNDGTPDAVADWNRAVQQAATEEVYTRAARRGQALPYVWIAAKTGTTDADVSYFG